MAKAILSFSDALKTELKYIKGSWDVNNLWSSSIYKWDQRSTNISQNVEIRQKIHQLFNRLLMITRFDESYKNKRNYKIFPEISFLVKKADD